MKTEENNQEQIGQTEEVTKIYSADDRAEAVSALIALANIANTKFTLPKWSQNHGTKQPYIIGSTELSLFSQEELGAIKEISKKYIQTLA
jgi:hypothetical protein